MKSTRRALRRHHRERMLQRALRSVVVSSLPEPARSLRARGWYNNLQKCSCYMCGNPRRHFGGPTRQERRLLEAALADAG